jgi:tetratricopeptide (TPR) repeat protein
MSWRDVPRDSLVVAEFLALSATEQAERNEAAARLSDQAAVNPHPVQSLNLYARALTLSPVRLDDWLNLSHFLAALGEGDLALECLDLGETLLERQAPEVRRDYRLAVNLQKAWIYRDRAQGVRMRSYVERCLRLDADARESMMLQGLAMADRGEIRGARTVARDIERINRMRRDWRPRFEWRWIRGMAKLAEGELTEAIAWMQRSRPEPQYANRFFRDLGDVCARAGEHEEARLYYGLSFEALGLGDADGIRMFQPEAEPGYPYWTFDDFSFVAGSRRAFADASVDSFHASAPGPRHAKWADTAAGMLSVCIRNKLDAHKARALRGMVYAEINALELAETDLSRVVNDPDAADAVNADVLVKLGFVYLQQERIMEALDVLTRAIEIDEGNARAWSYLGCAQMGAGHENEGLQSLNKAIALYPDLPEAWFNRGLFHFRGHRWAEAARDLERALELAPGNAEIIPMLQQSKLRVRRQQDPSS